MNIRNIFSQGPCSRALFTPLIIFLLATALWSLPSNVHAQPPQYTVTVLGSLGGSSGSEAAAVNASGQVVGFSFTAGNAADDAVVWNGTTPTVLGSLGGNSGASAINSSGQVAGYSTASGGAQDAVV